MSNFEAKFRFLQYDPRMKRMRNPTLTDQEWMDQIKPFMGNPFYAPGSLGHKFLVNKEKA